MVYYLEATAGSLSGSRFELSSRLIIGRDADVDIQVVEAALSRQHAAVLLNDEGEVYVMDLASKNGTFLSGQSVGREPLNPGDEFQVGESRFILRKGAFSESEEDRDAQSVHLASGPATGPTEMRRPLSAEERATLVAAYQSQKKK
jgi:pSer/pThr/pTyr-binding forkhead associated (FHA) protein